MARCLAREFRSIGRDLCAGDGLCSTACPVGINTGELVHVIRGRELSVLNRGVADFAARRFSFVAGCAGAMLGLASVGRAVLGSRLMAGICKALHTCSFGMIPLWTPATPGTIGAARLRSVMGVAADDLSDRPHKCSRDTANGRVSLTKRPEPLGSELSPHKVVYFPSCINQRMGPAPGGRLLVEETIELLAKAGYEVVFPEGMKNLCCGTIWESKGMPDIADSKTSELEAALAAASEGGRWPVLCDQSPCLHRMREKIKGMQLFEPAEFIERFVLDKVDIKPIDECVAVHVTCSTRRMGLADSIVRVARACALQVFVPEEIGCCAFAGDKGFTNPGLNAWALRKLRGQIQRAGAVRGYSNSRTCEIGLTTHSGITYESIVSLVNSVASPRS